MEGEAQKFLDKSVRKMLEFHANTLACEQKMQVLMRECKQGLEKDGDRPGKMILREWLKVLDIVSNKESGVVVSIKVQAVEAGIKLSHLLIDFVFMMLRQDELAEKIWKFKSALKWVTEDGNFNSMVIDKVLILLKMADKEMSEMKRSRELKIKGKAAFIDGGGQEERSSGRIQVNKLFDQFFDLIIYQIFELFLEVVLRLESIVSHRNLPADSEMLIKEALSMVESGLRQCEEVLEWIRVDIITLKKMFPLKLELKKDAKTTETRILVACRIDDLWSGALDNSSEEVVEKGTYIRRGRSRKAKFNGQNQLRTIPEEDENDVPLIEDDEGGDVNQMRSAGATRAEVDQGQSSLNDEGVDLPESASETEVEAEEPPKKCCCCCYYCK